MNPTVQKKARKGKGNPVFPWIPALLPVFLSLLFFLPVLRNGFVNWDDPDFIANNPHIRGLNPSNLSWMFSASVSNYWAPLTWLSLSLDYALGGNDPRAYHLDNLLLHLLNVFLVFIVSRRLLELSDVGPKPRSINAVWATASASLTALLFGLHPLRVESVAWASERKDVLCAFFFLLSLRIYLETPAKPGWRRWPIWACLGSFLLALMAKPMAVTLPFLFLLLDAWPLGKLRADPARALLEKIPFFALALAASAVAAAHLPADPHGLYLSLPFRVMHCFGAITFYLGKTVVPLGLHPFYPYTGGFNPFSLSNILSFLIVALVTWACWLLRRQKPWLGASWLYFILTLLPVLGLLQNGSQAFADRYTYLPSLAPLLAGAGCLAAALRARPAAFYAAALLAGLGLGILTARQTGIWENSMVFWEDVVRAYPDAYYLPHANLAETCLESGDLGRAEREFAKAEALTSDDAFCHLRRGIALGQLGRLGEAVVEFRKAATLEPFNPEPLLGLALAFLDLGRKAPALEALRRARALSHPGPSLYRELAWGFERAGSPAEAAACRAKAGQ